MNGSHAGSVGSDGGTDRGAWTPSLPQVIVLVLLVAIALTAWYPWYESMNPLGVETELTTEFDASVVPDDGSVVVTVVEESSGEPVSGATVVPEAEATRIDPRPERTTDGAGEVEFEFGEREDGITVEWPIGEDFASIHFEVDAGSEGYVDRRSNPTLTVERT